MPRKTPHGDGKLARQGIELLDHRKLFTYVTRTPLRHAHTDLWSWADQGGCVYDADKKIKTDVWVVR